MALGNRMEIVRRDCFKLTNFSRFPDGQLTYRVESAVAQNLRSWSSLLNSGSVFFFIRPIDLRFIAVHIPDRDHADQFSPDCEGHKQSTSLASLTQGVISLLSLGMTFITSNHQRLAEKHILGFLRS